MQMYVKQAITVNRELIIQGGAKISSKMAEINIKLKTGKGKIFTIQKSWKKGA